MNDNKWDTFINTGKIQDYLSYKNVNKKNSLQSAYTQGEQVNANNDSGSSNQREANWGQRQVY